MQSALRNHGTFGAVATPVIGTINGGIDSVLTIDNGLRVRPATRRCSFPQANATVAVLSLCAGGSN